MNEDTVKALQTGGKVMVLMTFLVILATGWKFANAYCGTDEAILAANSMVHGPLSTSFWLFEITIGLLLPCLILVASRLNSIHAMSAAALMILVGQFFSRYNLVVSGQIVPADYGLVGVPQYLEYMPTTAEYLIVIAGIGVVVLGFVVGERFLDSTFNSQDSH